MRQAAACFCQHILLLVRFLMFSFFYSLTIAMFENGLNCRSGRIPQIHQLLSCGTVFATEQTPLNCQQRKCWRKARSSPLLQWLAHKQPWDDCLVWREPQSNPWKPSRSYCLASSTHFEGRFKTYSWQQRSVCQKGLNFYFLSWWMQMSNHSKWFLLALHKTISSMLTRRCFYRGQSVCRGAPFLHPNKCHWGSGQMESCMLALNTWFNHSNKNGG